MIKTEITPELIFELYKNCDSFKSLLYELGVKFSIELEVKKFKLKFEIERHSSEEVSVITSLVITKDYETYYETSLESYYWDGEFPDRLLKKVEITKLSADEWVMCLKNASQKETFYYHFNEGHPERFWAEIEKFESAYGKTNTQKMIECVV